MRHAERCHRTGHSLGHHVKWDFRLTFPFNSGNSFQVNPGFQNSVTFSETIPDNAKTGRFFSLKRLCRPVLSINPDFF